MARVRHDDGPRRSAGSKAAEAGEDDATGGLSSQGPETHDPPSARARPGSADAGPSSARGLLNARAEGDEPGETAAVRPRTMDEYIGQAALKRKLRVFVDAAKQRGESLDHVLLHGPPGLGKTTMAQILATEMEVRIHITSGPAIEHKGILAGHLTALQAGDLLFIDEIHRLAPTVEESLYSAMEDRRIDLPVGEGSRARTMPFALAPFTLVGATTRTALLGAPLRERFQIVEGLEFYADDELAAIVTRTANILGFPATPAGALEIGRRSRGTPRIANRLTRRVRDFAQVRQRPAIDREDAEYALAELGIDPVGLDSLDRRMLTAILEQFEGGPVGIEALAATLSEPRDTLEDVVEPFLLQRGFLVRTPRGRQVSRKGLTHLGRDGGGGPDGGGDGGPTGQGVLPL